MHFFTRKLTLFLMVMLLCFGVTVPAKKAEAATVTNVLKAPKAAKGSWVYAQKGMRYKYSNTGNYANSGWLKVDGYIYYFTSGGYLKTGLYKYNGRYYYLSDYGRLQTGWRTIGGKNYYFWKSADKGKLAGSAAVGKVTIAGKGYYFSSGGVRQSGWIKIGNYYYYFYKSTGVMAKNTTVAGYKVDKDGKRISKAASSTSKSSNSTSTSTTKKTGSVDYWVGDSRTVGLATSMKLSSSKYAAKVGEGYTWYSNVAEAKIKAKLKSKPTATVVINLGVNDLDNCSKYIAKYKKLKSAYPKARIFIMSVNPIDTKLYKSGYVTDAKIKSFNKKMKAAFPSTYIDTYSYLKSKGFSTMDGLHYTAATYKKIYNYVLTKV